MITFFRTDRNNFLNLLLLRFYVKSVTLSSTLRAYISSNCISCFCYSQKAYIKKCNFPLIKANIKTSKLCYKKERIVLKNKSPIMQKLFCMYHSDYTLINNLTRVFTSYH